MTTRRPRVAIAGISHESSGFSLHRTVASDFRMLRGTELFEALDLRESVGPVIDGVDWVPILQVRATPGGPVDPAAFDAFQAEIIEGLRRGGPWDGVYLALHGAVHVAGREGAEERLVRAVRETVGPETILSASMDTHGNFSLELAELLDLACAHRHAPHIDSRETSARAVRNLLHVLETGVRPVRAHVNIPVLLPGERTSTLVEPGRSVFGELLPTIERFGVLDANLWVGFAWADEPRNAAAAFATGDDERSAVAAAEHLARLYWDARHDFAIVSEHSGSWEEALAFAETRPPAPLYLSDSGDNVSAGSTGDISYALRHTLESRAEDVGLSGLRFLFTGMVDPDAVAAAIAVGPGADIPGPIGAAIDSRSGAPVDGPWRVERLIADATATDAADPAREADESSIAGALLSRSGVRVIVQLERAYFIEPDDAAFRNTLLHGLAWLDPAGYDVVVVKNGYLFPSQIERAASWFMAVTPGGTDLDFGRLAFERRARPLFPFEDDFDPRLTATVLAARPASAPIEEKRTP